MFSTTLAIVLADGVGTQLHPLTTERVKPATPFGGKYRIIDFVLTNCLHSGVRRVLILTQYKFHSLQKHVRDGWSIFNPELGEYITLVPPQMRTGEHWYAGTADAIYQNLYLLERSGAKYIMILPGDHIYRMDYAPMMAFHQQRGAELTIACMDVRLDEAGQYGILTLDSQHRITAYNNTSQPDEAATDSDPQTRVSMGIYIFSTKRLIQVLEQDARNPGSSHDFSHDIIPQLIDRGRVYGYLFGTHSGRVTPDRYWRNVSTLDAYYQANMDLLDQVPPMNLYQHDWPIRTYAGQHPPARTVPGQSGAEGIAINAIISSGTVISGASAQRSILFNNVFVDDEALVHESILFEGVHIGKGAQINRCIIDKNVIVPDGATIGIDGQQDKARFQVSEGGVVVVPKDYRFDG